MGWFRVLVVEDFAPFRQLICKMLANRPHLQVIGEVSDGLEAVQKALELKPDLILLDIGLPKLNGIEAARQIRQLAPSSKIIFLSLYNDHDIVRAALATGGLGYVHKKDTRSELLLAVDSVLRSEVFVSSSIGFKFDT